MQPLLALILIQLITENFPISSSGHVALFEHLVQLFAPAATSELLSRSLAHYGASLEGLMHLPTMLIYGVVFFKQWIVLLKNPLRYRFIILKLAAIVLLIDLITAFSYFVLRIQSYHTPVWLGFVLTAGALASISCVRNRVRAPLTLGGVILLGITQSIALLPGCSRMGLTCMVALWLGLSPRRAMNLSCAMQVPLLAGAFVKSAVQVDSSFITEHILNLAGVLSILSALLISCICLRFTIKKMQDYDWSLFSLYTASIAVLSYFVGR